MRRSTLYLTLAIIGTLLPWIALAFFFQSNGLAIKEFFQEIFCNYVATAVAVDLIASGLIFLLFAYFEVRRMNGNMAIFWFVVPATLFVGLSTGFPLFLYFRERQIERTG